MFEYMNTKVSHSLGVSMLLYNFKKGTTENDIRATINSILNEKFPRHSVALEMAIVGGCYDSIPQILQSRQDKWSEKEAMQLLATTLFKYPSDIVIGTLKEIAPQWLSKDNNHLIKSAMKYGYLGIVQSLFNHKDVVSGLKQEMMTRNNGQEVSREDGMAFLARFMKNDHIVTLIKTNIEKRNGLNFLDSLLAVPKIRKAIVAHAKSNGQVLDNACSIDSQKEYLAKLDTFCQFKRKNTARI